MHPPAPVWRGWVHVYQEKITMNKTGTEKMIEQVAATMAIEDMSLTQASCENLRAMASGGKTREQVTQEITEKYKKRVSENG